ncbi:MAG: phosphoglycerate dehydrogenase [Bacteroidia bacterium]|nr:phosphoglycerate dehydrogenase [Bacteroidia bacterium]
MKNTGKTSYPKEKIKILLLEGIHPRAKKHFNSLGYKNVELLKSSLSEDELITRLKDVHLLGIRSKTQVTKKVIDSSKKLLGIGCFCIGTNQVEMSAAMNNGIAVFNAPFSNTRSVAELVIAEIILLKRNLIDKIRAAHDGKWYKDASGSHEVRGKTLGIIGYGHIGSQVSVLAENLGMKVIFYDAEPKLSMGNAVPVKNMDELLKNSDIVTLHVPGTTSTKNMISKKELSKMKKGAILINLSRGDVIVEKDVIAALKSKRLAGLALDVFAKEPKSNNEKFVSAYQGLNNVVLTPHIGGSTIEAQEAIGADVSLNLGGFLENGSTVGSLTVPALNIPVQENAHRILHIHKNVKGVLSNINTTLSKLNINILGQYLKTNEDIGYVVLDLDKTATSKVKSALEQVPNTVRVRSLY